MSILIVCRYNQARSIISGAVARKLFPNLEISTAGIEAQSGRPIPGATIQLCNAWRLSHFDRLSKSLEDFDEEIDAGKFEVVLAADTLVKSRLISAGVKSPIVVLTDYAESEFLHAVDPTGFSELQFQSELAKIALLTVRWIDHYSNSPRPKVIGSLSRFNENTRLFDLNEFQSIIVDAELYRPSPEKWRSRGFQVHFYNPRDLSNFEMKDLNEATKRVLVSRYEIDRPGAIYTSIPWRNFIFSLAQDLTGDLILVAEPESNELEPLKMLSLINTTVIQVE